MYNTQPLPLSMGFFCLWRCVNETHYDGVDLRCLQPVGKNKGAKIVNGSLGAILVPGLFCEIKGDRYHGRKETFHNQEGQARRSKNMDRFRPTGGPRTTKSDHLLRDKADEIRAAYTPEGRNISARRISKAAEVGDEVSGQCTRQGSVGRQEQGLKYPLDLLHMIRSSVL